MACLCVVRHAFHTVFTYFHNPSLVTQQVRVLSVQTYHAMQASPFTKGVRIGSLGHQEYKQSYVTCCLQPVVPCHLQWGQLAPNLAWTTYAADHKQTLPRMASRGRGGAGDFRKGGGLGGGGANWKGFQVDTCILLS